MIPVLGTAEAGEPGKVVKFDVRILIADVSIPCLLTWGRLRGSEQGHCLIHICIVEFATFVCTYFGSSGLA